MSMGHTWMLTEPKTQEEKIQQSEYVWEVMKTPLINSIIGKKPPIEKKIFLTEGKPAFSTHAIYNVSSSDTIFKVHVHDEGVKLV